MEKIGSDWLSKILKAALRAGGLHQPDPGAREAGGGPEPPRAPGHHLPHPRQLQPLARQHLRAAEAGGDQGGGRGVLYCNILRLRMVKNIIFF